MKLITKAIEKQLPKLYSTEQIPTEDKQVICKFFTPWSNWTWYVLEGERQPDGDLLFFGYVIAGREQEFGYFSLKELSGIRGMFGLGVERDLYLPRNLQLGTVMARCQAIGY